MKIFSGFFFALILLTQSLGGQILKPVKWTFSAKDLGNCEYEVQMKAGIDKGWHLYSQKPVEDGPVPTTFNYPNSGQYSLVGKTQEPKPISKFEKVFDATLSYFEKEVTFTQKVKLNAAGEIIFKGSVEFMVCDDGRCLPPETVDFEVKLNGAEDCKGKAGSNPPEIKNETNGKPEKNETGNKSGTGGGDCDSVLKELAEIRKILDGEKDVNLSHTSFQGEFKGWTKIDDPLLVDNTGSCNWWGNFLDGMLWGLGALLTPCVYSMIPLTVSFFTKQSKTRREGIRNALLYGFFIISIFVALSIIISSVFGGDALNEMASNIWANLFFFTVFMVFAFSFLGAFEIVLPASWINKTDSASEKGGVIGIFFMAFTLILVSFSCTGPFIGNLLVLVDKGNFWCPTAGFLGFSFCLALPFMLFALFPSWLNTMPKSGGWLNAVKVCLGLVEIALAMKFLSNADMVGGWHLISREFFLAVWIAVFGIMAIYLFGFLKFSHDSDIPYLTVTRSLIALMVLSFTIYLIPGLWGAPVKLISGFPPPSTPEWSENTEFFRAKDFTGVNFGKKSKKNKNAGSCPHNINCFHDYFEALEYAKTVGKPILLDFTGWTCVNCRRMEEEVWIDKEVLDMIKEEYVLVSLYVDDRTQLPENFKYTSPETVKDVKTTGNLWHDMQITRFLASAQPYYVLIDHNEKLLAKPRGYTPDIPTYKSFLNQGLLEFNKRRN